MNSAFNPTRLTREINGVEITMETGRLANQADGAIWVQSGGTVVLVSCVSLPMERNVDFFPLTVDYVEKMYAAGRVPGSFFRREIGRPSERETLCARLIDRPIRPLFPKGFRDEVQVIATVLSSDPEVLPDVLAISGASAALHMSQIPFQGPIAGARIGYVDNKFVFNPTGPEIEKSSLDMIFAATREAVVMVEGSATVIPHTMMAEALEWAREVINPILDMQEELRGAVGKPKMEFTAPEENPALKQAVVELAQADLDKALRTPDKMERRQAKKDLKKRVLETLAEREEFAETYGQAGEILSAMEKQMVRERIKSEGVRIDGRDTKTVRPINIDVGLLPRTHGSALFGRGETKVLAVCTLGSGRDEQRIESLAGDESKRFMLHYNFPPYCVGEIKMMRVSRREIGHGALAERSLLPVLPAAEDFPYTLRVVAEVMESNGSSSMASVCGASLAFMDAGVPIKAPVAGIAMGLIKEGDEYFVLTDIIGDEDALGDMDFKIAGTEEGITAFQMDIKVAGIPSEVMAKALAQARDARLHILGEMNKVLERPRTELPAHAPKYESVMVSPDIIRVIIGPGGKNIKAITADTGASIDVDDSGKVQIFAPNEEAMQMAKERVLYYDQRPEVGKVYEGPVKKLLEVGALVEILPGVEGLVHISQLDLGRVEKVTDVAKLGDTMKVKCLEVLPDGKMRLSRAAVLAEEQGIEFQDTPPRSGRPPKRDGGRNDRGGRGGAGGGRGGRSGGRGRD